MPTTSWTPSTSGTARGSEMTRLRERLGEERGFALVIALAVTVVFSMTVVTVIEAATSNSRSSEGRRAGSRRTAWLRPVSTMPPRSCRRAIPTIPIFFIRRGRARKGTAQVLPLTRPAPLCSAIPVLPIRGAMTGARRRCGDRSIRRPRIGRSPRAGRFGTRSVEPPRPGLSPQPFTSALHPPKTTT